MKPEHKRRLEEIREIADRLCEDSGCPIIVIENSNNFQCAVFTRGGKAHRIEFSYPEGSDHIIRLNLHDPERATHEEMKYNDKGGMNIGN